MPFPRRESSAFPPFWKPEPSGFRHIARHGPSSRLARNRIVSAPRCALDERLTAKPLRTGGTGTNHGPTNNL